MDDEARQRFREVVADCTPTMTAVAYLITGSQEAAEQALRRALASAARRWDRIGGSAPETHILKQLCRYEASWRRRLRPAARSEADPDAAGPGLRTAMQHALMALPVPDRVVLTLRHHEDLTEEETAEVLGCSVAAVRRRTDRAAVRLRELLAEMSELGSAAPGDPDDDDGAWRLWREPDV